jgi:hypothetical protein
MFDTVKACCNCEPILCNCITKKEKEAMLNTVDTISPMTYTPSERCPKTMTCWPISGNRKGYKSEMTNPHQMNLSYLRVKLKITVPSEIGDLFCNRLFYTVKCNNHTWHEICFCLENSIKSVPNFVKFCAKTPLACKPSY